MSDDPKDRGLSRKHLMASVDASLRRMKTDYIDLLIIHAFDPETPIEETMAALNDIIRAGKVRYLGASTMFAWQFVQMNHVARLNGWTPFVNMQCQYNLLYREEEREMLPYCRDQGIAVTAFSVLVRGLLSASNRIRSRTDANISFMYGDTLDREFCRRVETIARGPRLDHGGRRNRVGPVQGRHLLPDSRRQHGGPGGEQRRGARPRAHRGRDSGTGCAVQAARRHQRLRAGTHDLRGSIAATVQADRTACGFLQNCVRR